MCFLAWRDHVLAFIIVFFFVGASDIFDGLIARRFNVESKLGSQLDVIGDAAMLVGGIVSMALAWLNGQLELSHSWLHFTILIVATAAIVLLPFVFARILWGVWNKLHIFAYRLVGIPLFFFVPLFIWMERVSFWLLFAACAFIALATIEEIVTLFVMKEYNVNHNGVLGAIILGKELRE
jgi:CDP-diacylglycerol--glycerol-3-phosphate 3-phosphatidyltransferase